MTLGRVNVDVDVYSRDRNEYEWGTNFDVEINNADCTIAKLTDLVEEKVWNDFNRRWTNPSYLVYMAGQEQRPNLRIRINGKYMVNVVQG